MQAACKWVVDVNSLYCFACFYFHLSHFLFLALSHGRAKKYIVWDASHIIIFWFHFSRASDRAIAFLFFFLSLPILFSVVVYSLVLGILQFFLHFLKNQIKKKEKKKNLLLAILIYHFMLSLYSFLLNSEFLSAKDGVLQNVYTKLHWSHIFFLHVY